MVRHMLVRRGRGGTHAGGLFVLKQRRPATVVSVERSQTLGCDVAGHHEQ
jgi:hypothetical protein